MGILLKIVGFFGGKKSFSIVLVLLVVLGGYITYLNISNSSLEASNKHLEEKVQQKQEKIDELTTLANENAAKAKQLKKDYEYQLQLKEQTYKKQIKKIKTITVLKERTKTDDKNNDGAVAPILNSTLHGLQQLQADSYQSGKSKGASTK